MNTTPISKPNTYDDQPPSPHPYAEVPIPVPRNVTAFGDRAFKEMKLSTKVYRAGRKAEIGLYGKERIQ